MSNKHTGSTPTIIQAGLWLFLIALATPVTVPPVPALATITSTFSDEGFEDVDGVDTIASMISGPVVYSWARELLTWDIQIKAKNNPNYRSIRFHIGPKWLHEEFRVVIALRHLRSLRNSGTRVQVKKVRGLPIWLSGESQGASVGVRTTSAPSARRRASFSCQKKKRKEKGRCYYGFEKKKVAGDTYQRHLIRKGYDYRITLIYSIQYVFWTASLASLP